MVRRSRWSLPAGAGAPRAHEIRPAIVDLTFAGGGTVRLEMSLILEAALAESAPNMATPTRAPMRRL
jgi:hypothetical protein